jgi:purine nucleosidase
MTFSASKTGPAPCSQNGNRASLRPPFRVAPIPAVSAPSSTDHAGPLAQPARAGAKSLIFTFFCFMCKKFWAPRLRVFLIFSLALVLQAPASAQSPAKRLIIFDQDTAGPGGTDLMSLLVLLQDPNVQVPGVTVVQGDGWLDDEVLHALRLLEIVGRTDIPVAAGAAAPSVRTLKSTEEWEKKFGKVAYLGAWSTQPNGPLPAGAALEEGRPTTQPWVEDAGFFLERVVREHPHRVTIYEGGPMTNLARAIDIDPDFPSLTAGLVFMGGAVDPHSTDPEIAAAPHREFNLWFDPEAAAKVFRARWPSIICTTVDVSIETKLTRAMFDQIAASNTPAAQYIAKYSKPDESYMWDELAAAAWLDPTLITRTKSVFMDVNTDSASPQYGDTLVYDPNQPHDPQLQPVTAQMDVDNARFSQFFVRLMTAASTQKTLSSVAHAMPSER